MSVVKFWLSNKIFDSIRCSIRLSCLFSKWFYEMTAVKWHVKVNGVFFIQRIILNFQSLFRNEFSNCDSIQWKFFFVQAIKIFLKSSLYLESSLQHSKYIHQLWIAYIWHINDSFLSSIQWNSILYYCLFRNEFMNWQLSDISIYSQI